MVVEADLSTAGEEGSFGEVAALSSAAVASVIEGSSGGRVKSSSNSSPYKPKEDKSDELFKFQPNQLRRLYHHTGCRPLFQLLEPLSRVSSKRNKDYQSGGRGEGGRRGWYWWW